MIILYITILYSKKNSFNQVENIVNLFINTGSSKFAARNPHGGAFAG